jgi:malate/lactate dehydrogenase
MGLKRLGIAGAGNVGSALVLELASRNLADEVVVASRDTARSHAAILDAGSAYPVAATNFRASARLAGNFDVVVVTAGLMPHGAISQTDLLRQNLAIAADALEKVQTPIIVVTGTPVDRLTQELSHLPGFAGRQLIGFGGQLDADRTRYALLEHGLTSPGEVYVVGEHGPRAIPVYGGENQYDAILGDATSVLKRISAAGKARNLSTGTQLARLLGALAGQEQTLCVSAPHPGFENLSLTWPRVINEHGVVEIVKIRNLGAQASQLLGKLLEKRREEADLGV